MSRWSGRSGAVAGIVGLAVAGAVGLGPLAAASTAAASTPVAGSYVPVTQARVLDTDAGLGAPVGPIAARSSVTVSVAGHGGVPSTGAAAVALVLTESSSTSSGTLIAYPTGTTRPAASSLAYTHGRAATNLAVVRLGTGGAVTVYNDSPGTVSLTGSVLGWYRSGTATAPGTLRTVTPTRF